MLGRGEVISTLSKVNRVCDALRCELQKANKNNELLLPILTTYVKKEP